VEPKNREKDHAEAQDEIGADTGQNIIHHDAPATWQTL
jgi:hypothetical protein